MTSIANIFAPRSTDVPYERILEPRISLILRMDSYKFAHPFAYGKKINSMTSYGTARIKGGEVVVTGMQLLANKYLTERITMNDVNEAEQFALAHFGAPLFHREAWERVVTEYNGYLPLIVRVVPEGTVIPGGAPAYTVTVLDDPVCAWMSAATETLIQRGIWYPTTIASMDREIRREIKHLYERTGADMGLFPFTLHDFGGRGVSSPETAEIGGFAHLASGFMGSDTIEGIVTANRYYECSMAAFSVYATEHAVQTSFGPSRENAVQYLTHQINEAKRLGAGIVSIVIDGYDTFREAELLCTEPLRSVIKQSGLKVVFRPDSGDMMEVVPRILQLQEAAYGATLTNRGFKKINTVGIIQGDGVDHMAIKGLLGKIATMGYSADNVIFGSGGALLQKVNRDTYKFAQKACAIEVDGKWIGIAKDPVTDPGKKSLEGVLTLARSRMTGQYQTVRLDLGPLDEEWEDVHVLLYYKGQLFNKTTLAEVRERCDV